MGGECRLTCGPRQFPGVFRRRVPSAMGGLGAPGSVSRLWICPAASLLGIFRHTAQAVVQDFKSSFFLGDGMGTVLGTSLTVFESVLSSLK